MQPADNCPQESEISRWKSTIKLERKEKYLHCEKKLFLCDDSIRVFSVELFICSNHLIVWKNHVLRWKLSQWRLWWLWYIYYDEECVLGFWYLRALGPVCSFVFCLSQKMINCRPRRPWPSDDDDDDVDDNIGNDQGEDDAYLIFVTGATGGARVNFFAWCKFLQI